VLNPSGSAPSIKTGDSVKHPVFGIGMVLCEQLIGSDHVLEIAFENVGTKKFMADNPKLEKIDL
jgi:DNA helicase-2/ATP-dependent DNA helicase PcrA